MDAITEAYLDWSLEQARRGHGFCVGMEGDSNVPAGAGSLTMKIIDVFSKFIQVCAFFVSGFINTCLQELERYL
jgi:hypothetical protein